MSDVYWVCESCGASHIRNNPPCNTCGGMNYRTVQGVEVGESPSSSDDSRHTHFYIGAILGVIGVVLLPFFFFLIAIPEAIAGLFGSTTQKYLPRDARDNPFVSGTFMIFRWFGNFLLLMIVLGIVLGLLLVF